MRSAVSAPAERVSRAFPAKANRATFLKSSRTAARFANWSVQLRQFRCIFPGTSPTMWKACAHLRASVSKGLEIMESLRGHTSGYAVQNDLPFPVLSDMDLGYSLSLGLIFWVGAEVQLPLLLHVAQADGPHDAAQVADVNNAVGHRGRSE